MITIYRGEGTKSTPFHKSYSWTLDINTALFFASKLSQKGKVYKAKIKKKDIIDYNDGRNEQEIIVNSSNLINVKNMKLLNLDELLKKTKNEHILDKYYRYQYLVISELFLSPRGIHGILHTKRVLFLCTILSHLNDLSQEDSDLLYLSAIYHDIGRYSDDKCLSHGKKGIEKLENERLLNKRNKADYAILKFLIENHCIEDKQAIENLKESNIVDKNRTLKLFNILKDADGLDRVRLKELNTSYLRKPYSQQLILVAYQLLLALK